MARVLEFTVEISTNDDSDRTIEVSGTYDPGSPPRPFAYGGEGDPGDPAELIVDTAIWSESRIPLTDDEYDQYINDDTVIDAAIEKYSDDGDY